MNGVVVYHTLREPHLATPGLMRLRKVVQPRDRDGKQPQRYQGSGKGITKSPRRLRLGKNKARLLAKEIYRLQRGDRRSVLLRPHEVDAARTNSKTETDGLFYRLHAIRPPGAP